MRMRAELAPRKMCMRGWFMARMAAMRKVLSPISEMTMMEKAAMKDCQWVLCGCSDVTGIDGCCSLAVGMVVADDWAKGRRSNNTRKGRNRGIC